MQNSFNNTTSISSVSNLSFDGRKEKSGFTGLDGISTPKGSISLNRFDKKDKR